MLNKPAGWYRRSTDTRQHGYWDGQGWDEPEADDPMAVLSRVDGSERPVRTLLLVYKMSNQRRALKAVERLRRAGHDSAEIDNRRTCGIEVFLAVTVANAELDGVARLVQAVDPESILLR